MWIAIAGKQRPKKNVWKRYNSTGGGVGGEEGGEDA